jgi:MFS family permease
MNGFRDAAGYPEHPQSECGKNAASDPLWVSDQIGWIVGVFQIAALVAAPVAGFLADRFGRRFVIFAACFMYMAGAIIEACAGLSPVSTVIQDMYIGRVLTGFGNGFICMICPLYGAELVCSIVRTPIISILETFFRMFALA